MSRVIISGSRTTIDERVRVDLFGKYILDEEEHKRVWNDFQGIWRWGRNDEEPTASTRRRHKLFEAT